MQCNNTKCNVKHYLTLSRTHPHPHPTSGRGALIYQSGVQVPPSNPDIGVFRWQEQLKKGVLRWQIKNYGVFQWYIKLSTGFRSLKILTSVILTNQSLGQIIKMMGFWVTKSEIGGLWVTNQKLGVFEWQKIGGLWVATHKPRGHWVGSGLKDRDLFGGTWRIS